MVGYCVTYTLQPLLIRAILRYLENGVVDGVFSGCPPWSLAVLLSFDTALMSITMQHGWAQEICAAMALRVALMNTVMRKAMKLSTQSKSKTSTGQLITILSVDIDRIFGMVLFLQWGALAPSLICIVCGMIVREIGWVPAGIAFLILVVLATAQFFMAVALRKVRAAMTKYTDRRISLIDEVLHGIRVIKAYAWEPAAAKSVQEARAQELTQLTWLLSFIAINYCVMFITPVVVGLVAFVVYASYGNALTVSVVFTTFAAINLLRLPIKIVPMLAMRGVDAVVALKRLGRILDLEERPPRPTYEANDEALGTIRLVGVSFSWGGGTSGGTSGNDSNDSNDSNDISANHQQDKGGNNNSTLHGDSDKTTHCNESLNDLKQLSLVVLPGELVMVVGRVASGKTSLISALLGEMKQTNQGTMEVRSNQIAYVAQTGEDE